MNYDNIDKRKRRKRRRLKKPVKIFIFGISLFLIGFIGFFVYLFCAKPYTIALDAGHGGADTGAVGIINETSLTETTADYLEELLKADGRFLVVRSRKNGVEKSITKRNLLFQKFFPDIVLSIHGNASDTKSANGFECYPSPPNLKNHEESLIFAKYIAQEMKNSGAVLRGVEGIRFGYYVPDENNNLTKLLVDADNTTIYDYDTFGMLKNMNCPAVLVEQCFITNQNDVNNFGNDEGCKKCAENYYNAICKYLKENKK